MSDLHSWLSGQSVALYEREIAQYSVLYETKNKSPPVQQRSLLNRVSSCCSGGRGAFASASPATPSRQPKRVLFEILRQKLSCNEFPGLQSVFGDFSTGLQPAFALRYPAQHEAGPKESMKTSISKNLDIEKLRYRSVNLRDPYIIFSFDIEVIFDIGLLRSLVSQSLRYRSAGLQYPYANFSFDIEVIFDIGLLRIYISSISK
jgi:hypothetical protein